MYDCLSDRLCRQLCSGAGRALLSVRDIADTGSIMAVSEGLPAIRESDSSARTVFFVLGRRTGTGMSEAEPFAEGLDDDDMDLPGAGVCGLLGGV